MAFQLPDGIPPWVTDLVIGHIPVGDPEAMRRCADYLSAAADRLVRRSQELDDFTLDTVRASMDSETGAALQELLNSNAADMRAVSEGLDTLARKIYEAANALEFQQYLAKGIAIALTIQLTASLVMFAAGGSVIGLAQRLAAKEAVVLGWRNMLTWMAQILAKWIVRFPRLSMTLGAAALGMGIGGGVNYGAQRLQVAEGHRDNIEWGEVGVAVLAGGVGGVVGASAGRAAAAAVTRRGLQTASRAARMRRQVLATLAAGAFGGISGGLAGGIAAWAVTGGELRGRDLMNMVMTGFGSGLVTSLSSSLHAARAAGRATPPTPGAAITGVPGRRPGPVNRVAAASGALDGPLRPVTSTGDGHARPPRNLSSTDMARGQEVPRDLAGGVDEVFRTIDIDPAAFPDGPARNAADAFVAEQRGATRPPSPSTEGNGVAAPKDSGAQPATPTTHRGPGTATGPTPGSAHPPPAPGSAHPAPAGGVSAPEARPVRVAAPVAATPDSAPPRISLDSSTTPSRPAVGSEGGAESGVRPAMAAADAPAAPVNDGGTPPAAPEQSTSAPRDGGGEPNLAAADSDANPPTAKTDGDAPTGYRGDDGPAGYPETPPPDSGDGAWNAAPAPDTYTPGEMYCAPESVADTYRKTGYNGINPSALPDTAGTRGVDVVSYMKALNGDMKPGGWDTPRALVEDIRTGANGRHVAGAIQMKHGAHAFTVTKTEAGHTVIHERTGDIVRDISSEGWKREYLVDNEGRQISPEFVTDDPNALGTWLSELPDVLITNGVEFADGLPLLPLDGAEPGGSDGLGRPDLPWDPLGNRPEGGAALLERDAAPPPDPESAPLDPAAEAAFADLARMFDQPAAPVSADPAPRTVPEATANQAVEPTNQATEARTNEAVETAASPVTEPTANRVTESGGRATEPKATDVTEPQANKVTETPAGRATETPNRPTEPPPVKGAQDDAGSATKTTESPSTPPPNAENPTARPEPNQVAARQGTPLGDVPSARTNPAPDAAPTPTARPAAPEPTSIPPVAGAHVTPAEPFSATTAPPAHTTTPAPHPISGSPEPSLPTPKSGIPAEPSPGSVPPTTTTAAAATNPADSARTPTPGPTMSTAGPDEQPPEPEEFRPQLPGPLVTMPRPSLIPDPGEYGTTYPMERPPEYERAQGDYITIPGVPHAEEDESNREPVLPRELSESRPKIPAERLRFQPHDPDQEPSDTDPHAEPPPIPWVTPPQRFSAAPPAHLPATPPTAPEVSPLPGHYAKRPDETTPGAPTDPSQRPGLNPHSLEYAPPLGGIPNYTTGPGAAPAPPPEKPVETVRPVPWAQAGIGGPPPGKKRRKTPPGEQQEVPAPPPPALQQSGDTDETGGAGQGRPGSPSRKQPAATSADRDQGRDTPLAAAPGRMPSVQDLATDPARVAALRTERDALRAELIALGGRAMQPFTPRRVEETLIGLLARQRNGTLTPRQQRGLEVIQQFKIADALIADVDEILTAVPGPEPKPATVPAEKSDPSDRPAVREPGPRAATDHPPERDYELARATKPDVVAIGSTRVPFQRVTIRDGKVYDADDNLYTSAPDGDSFLIGADPDDIRTGPASVVTHARLYETYEPGADGVIGWGLWFVVDGVVVPDPAEPDYKLALGGYPFGDQRYDLRFIVQTLDVMRTRGVDITAADVALGRTQGRLWDPESIKSTIANIISRVAHDTAVMFNGFGNDYWISVSGTAPGLNSYSITLTVHPVRGHPGQVTVDLRREDGAYTARYSDLQPGRSPHHVLSALDRFHEQLAPWLAENNATLVRHFRDGLSEAEQTGAPRPNRSEPGRGGGPQPSPGPIAHHEIDRAEALDLPGKKPGKPFPGGPNLDMALGFHHDEHGREWDGSNPNEQPAQPDSPPPAPTRPAATPRGHAPGSGLDTGRLVPAAREGDIAAFDELRGRYHDDVARIVESVVRDRNVTAELTREIFAHAAGQHDRIPAASPGRWFEMLARQHARGYREFADFRARVAAEYGDLDDVTPSNPNISGIEAADRTRFRDAIRQLDEAQRRAVLMRVRDLQRAGPVATAMGIPVEQVNTLLESGLRNIATHLGPETGPPEARPDSPPVTTVPPLPKDSPAGPAPDDARRVAIGAVAAEVGVEPRLVEMVLQGRSAVADDVVALVNQAAERLGFWNPATHRVTRAMVARESGVGVATVSKVLREGPLLTSGAAAVIREAAYRHGLLRPPAERVVPPAQRVAAEITAGDVAAQAGVPVQKVYRVLRGEGSRDPEVAARILQAADELGFRTRPAGAPPLRVITRSALQNSLAELDPDVARYVEAKYLDRLASAEIVAALGPDADIDLLHRTALASLAAHFSRALAEDSVVQRFSSAVGAPVDIDGLVRPANTADAAWLAGVDTETATRALAGESVPESVATRVPEAANRLGLRQNPASESGPGAPTGLVFDREPESGVGLPGAEVMQNADARPRVPAADHRTLRLADIAQAAGVDVAAAHWILLGGGGHPEDVVQQVLDAAARGVHDLPLIRAAGGAPGRTAATLSDIATQAEATDTQVRRVLAGQVETPAVARRVWDAVRNLLPQVLPDRGPAAIPVPRAALARAIGKMPELLAGLAERRYLRGYSPAEAAAEMGVHPQNSTRLGVLVHKQLSRKLAAQFRPEKPSPYILRRARLEDVAVAAGVSTAEARRVLTGTTVLDPLAAHGVWDAVARLGFRPMRGASDPVHDADDALTGLVIFARSRAEQAGPGGTRTEPAAEPVRTLTTEGAQAVSATRAVLAGTSLEPQIPAATELITALVTTAQSPAVIHITRGDDQWVVVEVVDQSRTAPTRDTPDRTTGAITPTETGQTLRLLDEKSHSWGIELHKNGERTRRFTLVAPETSDRQPQAPHPADPLIDMAFAQGEVGPGGSAVRRQVVGLLEQNNWPDDQIEMIRLAVSEFFGNVDTYASEGGARVRAGFSGPGNDEFVLTISDESRVVPGWNFARVPAQAEPAFPSGEDSDSTGGYDPAAQKALLDSIDLDALIANESNGPRLGADRTEGTHGLGGGIVMRTVDSLGYELAPAGAAGKTVTMRFRREESEAQPTPPAPAPPRPGGSPQPPGVPPAFAPENIDPFGDPVRPRHRPGLRHPIDRAVWNAVGNGPDADAAGPDARNPDKPRIQAGEPTPAPTDLRAAVDENRLDAVRAAVDAEAGAARRNRHATPEDLARVTRAGTYLDELHADLSRPSADPQRLRLLVHQFHALDERLAAQSDVARAQSGRPGPGLDEALDRYSAADERVRALGDRLDQTPGTPGTPAREPGTTPWSKQRGPWYVAPQAPEPAEDNPYAQSPSRNAVPAETATGAPGPGSAVLTGGQARDTPKPMAIAEQKENSPETNAAPVSLADVDLGKLYRTAENTFAELVRVGEVADKAAEHNETAADALAAKYDALQRSYDLLDELVRMAELPPRTLDETYLRTLLEHYRDVATNPSRMTANLGSIAGSSDIGIGKAGGDHHNNQDSFAIAKLVVGGKVVQIAVAADGTSSSKSSELASAEATAAARDHLIEKLRDVGPDGGFDPIALVEGATAAAAAAVEALAQLPGIAGHPTPPAAAVVIALVEPHQITVDWRGDSRAYWLSPDITGSQRITEDDSIVPRLMRGDSRNPPMSEAEALDLDFAHTLSRFLGNPAGDTGESHAHTVPIKGPGLLFLGTDGAWGKNFAAQTLAATVFEGLAPDPGNLPAGLAAVEQHAINSGERDNITGVLVDPAAPAPPRPGPEPAPHNSTRPAPGNHPRPAGGPGPVPGPIAFQEFDPAEALDLPVRKHGKPFAQAPNLDAAVAFHHDEHGQEWHGGAPNRTGATAARRGKQPDPADTVDAPRTPWSPDPPDEAGTDHTRPATPTEVVPSDTGNRVDPSDGAQVVRAILDGPTAPVRWRREAARLPDDVLLASAADTGIDLDAIRGRWETLETDYVRAGWRIGGGLLFRGDTRPGPELWEEGFLPGAQRDGSVVYTTVRVNRAADYGESMNVDHPPFGATMVRRIHVVDAPGGFGVVEANGGIVSVHWPGGLRGDRIMGTFEIPAEVWHGDFAALARELPRYWQPNPGYRPNTGVPAVSVPEDAPEVPVQPAPKSQLFISGPEAVTEARAQVREHLRGWRSEQSDNAELLVSELGARLLDAGDLGLLFIEVTGGRGARTLRVESAGLAVESESVIRAGETVRREWALELLAARSQRSGRYGDANYEVLWFELDEAAPADEVNSYGATDLGNPAPHRTVDNGTHRAVRAVNERYERVVLEADRLIEDQQYLCRTAAQVRALLEPLPGGATALMRVTWRAGADPTSEVWVKNADGTVATHPVAGLDTTRDLATAKIHSVQDIKVTLLDETGTVLPFDRAADDAAVDAEIHSAFGRLGARSEIERLLLAKEFIDHHFWVVGLIAGGQPVWEIFGKREFLGWLGGKVVALEHGEQPMTVDFIRDVHRAVAAPVVADQGGVLRFAMGGMGGFEAPLNADGLAAIDEEPLMNFSGAPFETGVHGSVLEPAVPGRSGAAVVRHLDVPLTEEQRSAVDADPLASYMKPGSKYPHGGLIYPVYADEAEVVAALQEVCDWFEGVTRAPHNPYEIAALMQKKLIVIHPFAFDYNGRVTRILMNWSLQRAGLHPAILGTYEDMTETAQRYTARVRSGSEQNAEWHARLTSSDATDPITFFGLGKLRELFRQHGGDLPPLAPGETHRPDDYIRLLATLAAIDG
ncbi:Fic family protein [Nocardia sp. NPDC024068]|uniref:Fic family protein n=1 Tax=Nocardia sp. NPDC024068 TaxID=3157197 RepID=UPI00340D6672